MAERNIILTGFMGTGKSTVGRLLANRLGYEWVDTDAVIESRHGPIPEIFAKRGEGAFRRLERELAEELAERSGLVISTGGRMMLDPRSAQVLGYGSRIFCLTATAEEIQRRVDAEQGAERPLLSGEKEERIDALLAERAEGYGRFEQVPTDGSSFDEVVEEIVARLGAEPPGSDIL